MTSTPANRLRSLGALAIGPLAFAALLGCSDQDLTEQTSQKVKRLSDFDDDGMYFSDDCMRADGSEGCVVMPGPTECTFLQITTTTTVLVDASGNIVREETTECVACLADDLSVISETCSGTVTPVICEPAPTAGDGSAGGGEADVPAGVLGAAECWICTYEDGTTSYECIDPTLYCTTDAECPTGYHCESYLPPPTCDPGVPCDTPAGAPESDPAAIAPVSGQCVPDAPIYCSTDADCPMGYYCEVYGGGTDPGTGSGGSGVPASDLWVGGQCVPYEPPPPPCTSDGDCGEGGTCVFACLDPPPPDGSTGCRGYCVYEPPPPPCTSDGDCGEGGTCVFACLDPPPPDGSTGCRGYCVYEPPPPPCTSDGDCGEGGTCVFACLDPPPPDGSTGCRGYCVYEPPPPPCGCEMYYDQMSCEADPRCDWFTDAFIPCDPSGTCGGYGYCGAAPPSP